MVHFPKSLHSSSTVGSQEFGLNWPYPILREDPESPELVSITVYCHSE
jgi:hypothetical protein